MQTLKSSPPIQLLCRNLRCKEMYYQQTVEEEDPFASNVYWCAKTQEAFGPDGQAAGKKECCAGRGCYAG